MNNAGKPLSSSYTAILIYRAVARNNQNISNGTSGCEFESEDWGDYMAALKVLCCSIGIVVNIIEIVIFTSKELRNRCSYMLTANSISNLMLLLLEMGTFVTAIYSQTEVCLNYVVFHVYYYMIMLESVPYVVSLCMMVWLSIERYLAVCKPMWRLTHKPKAKLIAVSIAFLACSFTVLRTMLSEPKETFGHLSDEESTKIAFGFNLYWFIFYLILPSVVLATTTVLMTCSLEKRELKHMTVRRRELSTSALSIRTARSASPPPSEHSGGSNESRNSMPPLGSNAEKSHLSLLNPAQKKIRSWDAGLNTVGSPSESSNRQFGSLQSIIARTRLQTGSTTTLCSQRKSSPAPANDSSATIVIIGITALFLLTAALPRSLIIFSQLCACLWNESCMDYAIQPLMVIEILGYLSPDSIVYFCYNAKYRKKCVSLLSFRWFRYGTRRKRTPKPVAIQLNGRAADLDTML